MRVVIIREVFYVFLIKRVFKKVQLGAGLFRFIFNFKWVSTRYDFINFLFVYEMLLCVERIEKICTYFQITFLCCKKYRKLLNM